MQQIPKMLQGEGNIYHADIDTLVLQNFPIEIPYTVCLLVINLKKSDMLNMMRTM